MSSNQQIQSIIASALALPEELRLQVLDAIHVSLADPSVDHGPVESVTSVAETWKDEIARRIEDVTFGKIKTVPADEAERMIRSNDKPSF